LELEYWQQKKGDRPTGHHLRSATTPAAVAEISVGVGIGVGFGVLRLLGFAFAVWFVKYRGRAARNGGFRPELPESPYGTGPTYMAPAQGK
jgi:hypothetical protein